MYKYIKFFLALLLAQGALFAADQTRLGIGYSAAGAVHVGEAESRDGEMRIHHNELLLEFYTKTDNWEFQRQTRNRAWVSRKAIASGSKDGFIIEGMVAKNEYRAEASLSAQDEWRVTWKANLESKNDDYRVLNEAGFALILDEDAPITITVDGVDLDGGSLNIYKSNRGPVPKNIVVSFPSGKTMVLSDFFGISGWVLTPYKGEVYLGFVSGSLATGTAEFGATIQCSGATFLPTPAFEFTHSHANWFPIRIPFGPAFDDVSSVVLDPPAGKYGFATVRDGKFQFEKAGGPVRFHGVQLVHGSKFPRKDEVDELVGRIAGMGSNIVRLHHLDYHLPGNGVWKRSDMPRKHEEFDAELMDRMDYLIHKLKERGIYIHLDGITAIRYGTDDGVAAHESLTFGLKGSGYLYDSEILLEKQKQFMTKLWNHRNRYTGLYYKDDPVFVTTEITNENDLFTHGVDHHIPAPYKSVFMEMFRKWVSARKGKPVDYSDTSDEIRSQFLIDTMHQYYQIMREHLKSQGVGIPIAGTNWMHGDGGSLAIMAANKDMDYTALHPYGASEYFRNPPAEKGGRAATLALGKIPGKPLVHNEWNMTNSNGITRVASILYQIALSAAAGHDASYLFALFHGPMEYDARHINSLNVGYDPAVNALFPAASILFVRGDMKQPNIDIIYNPPERIPLSRITGRNYEDYLPGFSRAAFWGGAAVNYSGKNYMPDRRYVQGGSPQMFAMLPPVDNYPAANFSGELESWWKEGYFIVKTPRSKWAVGYLPGGIDIDLGDDVHLKLDTDQFACISLTSLDDAPISESHLMRLATVSYVEQAEMYFNRKWQQPERMSKEGELLCKPVIGNITFGQAEALFTVQAVAADGSPSSMNEAQSGHVPLKGTALVYKVIRTPAKESSSR